MDLHADGLLFESPAQSTAAIACTVVDLKPRGHWMLYDS